MRGRARWVSLAVAGGVGALFSLSVASCQNTSRVAALEDGSVDAPGEAAGEAAADRSSSSPQDAGIDAEGASSDATDGAGDVALDVPFPYACPPSAPCCACTVDGGGTCDCLGGSVFA